MTVLDLIGGKVELAGTVSSMREVPLEEGTNYYIQVEGRGFKVNEDIYYWVSESEEVVVTIGKHTETVVKVRKLGAETIPADIEA